MSTQLVIFVRDFAIFFGIQLIVALSLNLEYGYAGVPNFGKVLAVAGGAFTAAIVPGRLIAGIFGLGSGLDYIDSNTAVVTEINAFLEVNPGISLAIFFITLAIAAVVGAVLGLIASYPAIRLREDYLSITLLAMGEAIYIIGYNFRPLLKGSIGVLIPDPFRWAGELRYQILLVCVLGVGFALFLYLEKLVNTPLGRMLRAIRDNEHVAEALGKKVTSTRMKVIIIASAIGAIAGAIDAFKSGGILAPMYRRVTWTFWPWVIVILGGPANNRGIVLGTFVYTMLRRVIDFYKSEFEAFVPFSVFWLHSLLLGILLIIILIYRPEGLLREKPIKTLNYSKIRGQLLLEEETDEPSRKNKITDKLLHWKQKIKNVFNRQKT
jgi:branched-chain amino acid transport system permease protein